MSTSEKRKPWKVKEVADALRTGNAAIYGEIAAGKIRVIRIGRLIRIPPDEAERLVTGK